MAAGEQSELVRICRNHRTDLVALARRLGGEDPEGTADVVLVDGQRALGRLGDLNDAQLGAYLKRSVRNRVIDEFRKQNTQVRTISIEMPEVASPTMSDDPEGVLITRDSFTRLLDLLTDAEREVVAHRYVGGFSDAEVADRVGRSTSAVRRLHSNALRRLRSAGPVVLISGVVVGLAFHLAGIGGGQQSIQTSTAGPAVGATDSDGPGDPGGMAFETDGAHEIDLGFEEGPQADEGGWFELVAGDSFGQWTVEAPVSRDQAAHHGGPGLAGHYVDLGNRGVIGRPIAGLEPGTTYEFTFGAAYHFGVGPTATAEVRVGETVYTVVPAASSSGPFESRSFQFTPATPDVEVELVGTASSVWWGGVVISDPVIRVADR